MISKLWKWAAASLRLACWKLRLGRRLVLARGGKLPYIGKGCILRCRGSGSIQLKSAVYLSEYVTLDADGGKICLEDGVFLNTFSRVCAMESVSIGTGTMFGSNVSVYDHDHDISQGVSQGNHSFLVSPVVVESSVWCGTNVVVTRGSHIRSNTVVGANAVVRGVLESGGVYVGAPARRVRENRKAE